MAGEVDRNTLVRCQNLAIENAEKAQEANANTAASVYALSAAIVACVLFTYDQRPTREGK